MNRKLSRFLIIASILGVLAEVRAAEFRLDPKKVAAGAEVYSKNCMTCHGKDLVNSTDTFDLRRLRENERSRFNRSVYNGKNSMPPWEGVLNEMEVEQLWHYIRSQALYAKKD